MEDRLIYITCHYNDRTKLTSAHSIDEMHDIRNECLRIWKEEGETRWNFRAKYVDTGESIEIENEFSR